MVRVAWLCRKSPKGCELKAGLCYDYWKTCSVNPAVNIFESGKNKAAKGAGLAPPFFGCAHDIVGL